MSPINPLQTNNSLIPPTKRAASPAKPVNLADIPSHAAEYLPSKQKAGSETLKSVSENKTLQDALKDFDLEAFQARMRQELLDLITAAKEGIPADTEMVDPILYAVEPETTPAEVPEYWNAENTSQRIVDFAMSFADLSTMKDEEFISSMRDAVVAGFQEARDIIGELPGPAAKLFNDTYELTMKKFDALLQEKATVDKSTNASVNLQG